MSPRRTIRTARVGVAFGPRRDGARPAGETPAFLEVIREVYRIAPMRTAAILLLAAIPLAAQEPPATAKALAAHDRSNDRDFEDTQRAVDDAIWYFRLGDVATIDKYE